MLLWKCMFILCFWCPDSRYFEWVLLTNYYFHLCCYNTYCKTHAAHKYSYCHLVLLLNTLFFIRYSFVLLTKIQAAEGVRAYPWIWTKYVWLCLSIPMQITLGVSFIVMQVSWILGYFGKLDYFIQPHTCSLCDCLSVPMQISWGCYLLSCKLVESLVLLVNSTISYNPTSVPVFY